MGGQSFLGARASSRGRTVGLSARSFAIIVGSMMMLATLAAILSRFDDLIATSGLIVVACGLVVALTLRSHEANVLRLAATSKHLERQAAQRYRQLEALMSITQVLDLKAPLPPGRSWAASPDLARLLVETTLEVSPERVVELGGGYSTIVVGYCLKAAGRGHLVSLDHDAAYADQTRRAVKLHGLDDHVTVLHAPLEPVELDGREWQWYSLDAIDGLQDIDLLVVDGPPALGDELARYPAIPLLEGRLSEDAVVVLDDGVRSGEREIVERWSAFRLATFEYVGLEKGAFVGRLR